jgi:hypothetical protein
MNAPADLSALVATCRANPAPMTPWESDFLADMEARRLPVSARQRSTLERIAARDPVDYAAINRAVAVRSIDVCRRLLPGGVRRGREWTCGDLSGAAGGSLLVRLEGERAGRWIDNATSERGGDFVSLAAAVARVRQDVAARYLARMLGVGSAAP